MVLKRVALVGALTLALLGGGAAPAVAERQEVVSVPATVQLDFSREPTGGVLRAEKLSTEGWIAKVLAEAGVASPVAVSIVPDGSICAGVTAYGCTKVKRHADGSFTVLQVWIAAGIVGTPLGAYVLLHEVGHAQGNYSECAADRFAMAHGAPAEHRRC